MATHLHGMLNTLEDMQGISRKSITEKADVSLDELRALEINGPTDISAEKANRIFQALGDVRHRFIDMHEKMHLLTEGNIEVIRLQNSQDMRASRNTSDALGQLLQRETIQMREEQLAAERAKQFSKW